MNKKLNLAEFIQRQLEITKNVTINERNYASRYSYRFGDQDLSEVDEIPGDEPAQEPVAPAGPATEPQTTPETPQGGEMGAEPAPTDDMGLGDDMGADLGTDPGAEDDMGLGGDDMGAGDDIGAEPDTEIDVTELVNGTKEASAKIDGVLQKMDQTTANINSMLQKVGGLESTIANMSTAISSLSQQIELMRPPTEDERRKAVQQSSYPFNQSIQDATSAKQTQTDLENSSKTKLNMDNIQATYNQSEIKGTF